MIKENKFSKYFLYAIGEIVLVVIGILIALSINNWNEEKREVQKEIVMLKELRSTIKNDANDLLRYESVINVTENGIKNILKEFEENTYSDTLNHSFGSALFKNEWAGTYATYETLKSEGLSLISNDTLRKKVIDLYESSYPFITESEKNNFMDYNHFLNYYSTLFDNIAFATMVGNNGFNPRAIKPHSIKDLRQDKLFLTLIKTRLGEIEFLKYFAISIAQERHKDLLALIDRELKRLEL